MKTNLAHFSKVLLQFVFFVGLFLLPFIFWPGASIPYEIPRVWFTHRWIELLGLVGLIRILILPRQVKSWVDSKLVLLVLVFVAITLLASLLGANWPKSVWGNYYRHDGLFTLLHLVGLFFFLITFWQNSWRRYAASSIAWGSLLVSGWTVVCGIRLHILGDRTIEHWQKGAIGTTFGQPNFLAGYLAVTLPFLYFLYHSQRKLPSRLFWIGAFGTQIIAIGLTNSRGGLLTVLLFLFCLVIFQKVKTIRIRRVLVASVIFMAFTLFFSFFIWYHTRQAAEGRERIFRKVFMGTMKRPVLGWGWANVDYAFNASIWPEKYFIDVYVDKAHASILEIFATTGISGLMVYLASLGYCLSRIFIRWQTAKTHRLWYQTLFFILLLYIVHAQTNVVAIAEEVIFWFTLGVMAKVQKPIVKSLR